MTHYSVEISEQAAQDLRGVFAYIAYELKSVQNASGQLARLEKAILSLEQMPERFRRYKKEPWHSRGMRMMPVDNFVVFYLPDHDRQVVSIVRVMYGGRDIEAELDRHSAEEEK